MVIDFASPARVMCAECVELSRPAAVYVGDAPPVDPGYSWCPPSPLAVEPIAPAADWECPAWLPWVMLVGVCLLVGALIVVEKAERRPAGASNKAVRR